MGGMVKLLAPLLSLSLASTFTYLLTAPWVVYFAPSAPPSNKKFSGLLNEAIGTVALIALCQ